MPIAAHAFLPSLHMYNTTKPNQKSTNPTARRAGAPGAERGEQRRRHGGALRGQLPRAAGDAPRRGLQPQGRHRVHAPEPRGGARLAERHAPAAGGGAGPRDPAQPGAGADGREPQCGPAQAPLPAGAPALPPRDAGQPAPPAVPAPALRGGGRGAQGARPLGPPPPVAGALRCVALRWLLACCERTRAIDCAFTPGPHFRRRRRPH